MMKLLLSGARCCAAASVLLLAGCGSFGPPAASTLYVLHPQIVASSLPRSDHQLSIALPSASQSLDTDRIALTMPPAQMDYYARSTWTDHVPQLWQTFLLEAFETGKFAAVSRETDGLHEDYLLQADIRDFEAQYAAPDAAPKVSVRLAVKLISIPDRNVVGTLVVEKNAQATANDMPAVVAAFDRASSDALKDIVDWTSQLTDTSQAASSNAAPSDAAPMPRHHRRHRRR